jgi:hypothetical protein
MSDAKRNRRDDPLRFRGNAEKRLVVRCANCHREVAASIAEEAGFRYWSDGLGELHAMCAECAKRESGHTR